MKGYLPLAILLHVQVLSGFAVVPAAIAPVIGHAFSPFLKFRAANAQR
jgi:glycerol-3-phosphate acyltransferase PlsY